MGSLSIPEEHPRDPQMAPGASEVTDRRTLMSIRVGINGFGRIGRQSLRAMLERHPDRVQVVAINDVADLQTNAHLFRHDSNYGAFPGRVETRDSELRVNDWRSEEERRVGKECRSRWSPYH